LGRYHKGRALGSRFGVALGATPRAPTNASIANANLDKIPKFATYFLRP